MKQSLQPTKGVAIVEDDGREGTPVDLAVRRDNSMTHPRDNRFTHVRAAQEVMDDLVARHRRGAVPGERPQGLALSRSDAAGDRDGYRFGHSSELESSGAGASSAGSTPAPVASASAVGASASAASAAGVSSASAAGASSAGASSSRASSTEA